MGETLSSWMFLHGGLVLLVGFATGAPLGGAILADQAANRINGWRVAHSGLSVGGVAIIAVGLALPHLGVGDGLLHGIAWCFIASGWGFTLVLPYGAFVGQRGLSNAGPASNRVVFLGNMVGAVGSLIGALLFVVAAWQNLP
jgi:hypothetical protein